MTTTAAAWRHRVVLVSSDGDECIAGEGHCGCTDPTPDPASPCAVCPTGSPVHEYVPTRCACGHSLEAVR